MHFKCGMIFLLMLVGGIGYCVCDDQHTECSNWASHGECERNPGYMLINCPNSCRVDCVPCRDHHPQCSEVKHGCFDFTVPEMFSLIHDCPKTCEACT